MGAYSIDNWSIDCSWCARRIQFNRTYLGCEKYGRWGEEQWVHAIEGILGVKAFEVHRRCRDHLLPQFELLPQSLDEVGEENYDLLVLFFSRDGATWEVKFQNSK